MGVCRAVENRSGDDEKRRVLNVAWARVGVFASNESGEEIFTTGVLAFVRAHEGEPRRRRRKVCTLRFCRSRVTS
jgi:hypothetical protein